MKCSPRLAAGARAFVFCAAWVGGVGVAQAGPLNPNPAMVTFADTAVGSCDGPRSVDFQNKSGAAVKITDFQAIGPDAGQFKMVPPGAPITMVDGATISVDVSFCPLGATGLRGATLRVVVNMVNVDVPLAGKAVGPQVSVSPNPIVLGGVKLGAQVPPVTVTVTNIGAGTLNVASVAPAGMSAGLLSLGGLPGFPQALAAGKSFSFTVSFMPVAKGPAAVSLRVLSDDPLNPIYDAAVQAYVGDPRVVLGLGTLIFGDSNVGITTDKQDVDLTNGGYSDLNVTAIEVVGPNATDFALASVLPAPPYVLQVGAGAKFSVNCTPMLAGKRTASVQITSDDPASPRLLPLSCNGTVPNAMVDPGPIDFGLVRVNSTRKLPVTIKNGGDGPVTVTSLTLVDTVMNGVHAAAYTADLAAPFVVAPKGSQVVNLTFAPVAPQVYDNVALKITTDDPRLPFDQVDLTGAGVAGSLEVKPLQLDFGDVAVGQKAGPMAFTIKNVGNDQCRITGFQTGGPGQNAFTLVPLPPKPPWSIAAGASLTYGVTYTPFQAGGDQALVLISSDCGDAQIALSGNGLQGALSTVPADMDQLTFDATPVGSHSRPQLVKITNYGSVAVGIRSVTVNKGTLDQPQASSDFVVSDGGPFQLAPSQSRTIEVSFAPTAAVKYDEFLVIEPDAPGDPSLASIDIFLSGLGVPTFVTCFTTAPDNSLNFGAVGLGMPASQSVFILNGSAGPQPIAISSSLPEVVVDHPMVTLAPSGKLMILATFTPDQAQAYGGALQVTEPNGTTPFCVIPFKGIGSRDAFDNPDAMFGIGAAGASGCSCAVGRHDRSSSGAPLPLLVLGLVLAWRRRARARGQALARAGRAAGAALVVLLGVGGVGARADAAPLNPNPAMLTFADTVVGSCDGPRSVDLQNKSGLVDKITDFQLIGPDAAQFTVVTPGVPLTLVDGASVSVDVTFCPLGATGLRSATLRVVVSGANVDVPLAGKGVGPQVSVSPAPIVIGGVKLGMQVPPVTVTVTNIGAGTLSVTSVAAAGADAGLFSLGGLPKLPQALAAGKSFSFTLSFLPVAKGPAAVSLRVLSDDPQNPIYDAAVQAYVGDPRVTLGFGQLLFGDSNVGITTDPQVVDLTNGGYSDLNVAAIDIVGPNATDFALVSVKPATPFSLQVGAGAKFTVNCTPMLAGMRTASVQITSDDPASPKLLPLSCNGTVPNAMVDPGPVDFGAVRLMTGKTLPITITNAGAGKVTVTSLTIVDTVMNGMNAAAYTADLGAPFVVAGKSSQVVRVTFTPILARLYDKVAMKITTDDPKLPFGQVDLTGSGASGSLEVKPMAIDFGAVPVGMKAVPKDLTVKNVGNADCRVTAFQIGGPGQVAFDLVPKPKVPPFTIAAGQMLASSITYAPFDGSGDQAYVLVNADCGDANIPLTGVGAQAVMVTVPADQDTLAFPPTPVGSTSNSMAVKISNVGTEPLHLKQLAVYQGSMNLPVASTDFVTDTPGPFDVPPNQSKVVQVSFRPGAPQQYDAWLEIDPDAALDPSLQPARILLSGLGLQTNISCITAEPDNALDFGVVREGQSAALDITILNGGTGAQPLAISSSLAQLIVSRPMLTVAAGGKADVLVTFVPKQVQAYSGLVTVTLADSATPLCVIPMKGEGVKQTTDPLPDGFGVATTTQAGCSCTVAGHDRSSHGAPLPLLLLGLALVGRRRVRRRWGGGSSR